MSKKFRINLIGGGFQHDVCSSAGHTNQLVEWVKDRSAPISMHIDHALFQPQLSGKTKKFGWILESSAIIPDVVEGVRKDFKKLLEVYELMFSHDRSLVALDPRIRFCIPNSVPWVQDRRIYSKTKLCSMVTSTKLMCEGHRYRLNWAKKLSREVDLFGTGHRPVEKKETALADYMFSVQMENANYASIFTEKITDCFATGTIPIFWGTPDIGNYFNTDGILLLTENFKVSDLSRELYESKREAILDNFERALKLESAEDEIFKNDLRACLEGIRGI